MLIKRDIEYDFVFLLRHIDIDGRLNDKHSLISKI